MNGIAKKNVDPAEFTGGIFMITIGIMFLLSRLDFAEVSQVAPRYWPVVVVMLGLSYSIAWPLLLIALGAGVAIRALVQTPMRREARHEN
jgi:hypothetical protein